MGPRKLPPVVRKQCCSDHGYRLHLAAGEYPCTDCLEAHRLDWAKWKARAGVARVLKPCGTRAAYKRHLRNNEPVCWRCRLANRTGQEFIAEEMAA